jgi:hypothetical protein
MKRIIASIISLGALVPLFWFDVVPHGKQFCPRDSQGNLKPYIVDTVNGQGNPVQLKFMVQDSFCSVADSFPR